MLFTRLLPLHVMIITKTIIIHYYTCCCTLYLFLITNIIKHIILTILLCICAGFQTALYVFVNGCVFACLRCCLIKM